MKIFVAAPFTNKIDPENGQVASEFKDQLALLYKALREQGHTVISAQEREQWGANLMPPDVCTPLDFAGIRECDLLVAVPEASGGVHMEIGYATAYEKPIIQILHEEGTYTPLLQGIRTVTSTVRLYFRQSITEVVSSLQDAVTTLVANGDRTQFQVASIAL